MAFFLFFCFLTYGITLYLILSNPIMLKGPTLFKNIDLEPLRIYTMLFFVIFFLVFFFRSIRNTNNLLLKLIKIPFTKPYVYYFFVSLFITIGLYFVLAMVVMLIGFGGSNIKISTSWLILPIYFLYFLFLLIIAFIESRHYRLEKKYLLISLFSPFIFFTFIFLFFDFYTSKITKPKEVVKYKQYIVRKTASMEVIKQKITFKNPQYTIEKAESNILFRFTTKALIPVEHTSEVISEALEGVLDIIPDSRSIYGPCRLSNVFLRESKLSTSEQYSWRPAGVYDLEIEWWIYGDNCTIDFLLQEFIKQQPNIIIQTRDKNIVSKFSVKDVQRR